MVGEDQNFGGFSSISQLLCNFCHEIFIILNSYQVLAIDLHFKYKSSSCLRNEAQSPNLDRVLMIFDIDQKAHQVIDLDG